MTTVVSIDGQLVAPEAATISVFDRGLLYGDGCFEVLRTWNQAAVDLEAHLDRLLETCGWLQLEVDRPALAAAADAAVAAAVRVAGDAEHRIRIVVTRGPGGLDRRLADAGPGRQIVIVEPLVDGPRALSATVIDWPLAPRAGRGHKALAYLDHVIGRELARATGADEAIRLDGSGRVVEGATSNVFAVVDGVVTTPPVDHGVLPGITRAHVLGAGARLGIELDVRAIPVDEFRAADEWFSTSAVRGVVPITSLDGAHRPLGPVTARLASAYAETMQRRA